jgi:hypothetical protein
MADPIPLTRRGALLAPAVGITALALPSAAAQASPQPDIEITASTASDASTSGTLSQATIDGVDYTFRTWSLAVTAGTTLTDSFVVEGATSTTLEVTVLTVGMGGAGFQSSSGAARGGGGGGGVSVAVLTLTPGSYDVLIEGSFTNDTLSAFGSGDGLVSATSGNRTMSGPGGASGVGTSSGASKAGGAPMFADGTNDIDTGDDYGGGGGGAGTIGEDADDESYEIVIDGVTYTSRGRGGRGGDGFLLEGFYADPIHLGAGGGGDERPGALGEGNPGHGATASTTTVVGPGIVVVRYVTPNT